MRAIYRSVQVTVMGGVGDYEAIQLNYGCTVWYRDESADWRARWGDVVKHETKTRLVEACQNYKHGCDANAWHKRASPFLGTSLPNVYHLRFVRHHCGVLAHRVDAWDDELRAGVC